MTSCLERSQWKGAKKVLWAGLLSLAVILHHPNLPTQRQTSSEALSNLHEVEAHWFALAPRVRSPWTWLRSWRGHGSFINGTCLNSSQIFEGLCAPAGGRRTRKLALSLLVCTRGGAALCACSYAKVWVRAQKGARGTLASIWAFMRCQCPPGPHRWAFTPSAGYANIMCAQLREEHIQLHLTNSDQGLQTNTLCWGFDKKFLSSTPRGGLLRAPTKLSGAC